MVTSNCGICGSKKSRYITEQEASEILGNLLPILGNFLPQIFCFRGINKTNIK